MAGTGYKRWTPDEMLRIAVHALPLADTGDKFEMMKVGMRTSLPKARWKSMADLKRQTVPSYWARFQEYLTKAAKLPEQERQRIIKHAAIDTTPQAKAEAPEPAMVALPVLDKPRATRWTDVEWAMIARRVKYMRDGGDSRENIARMIFDAQTYELKPDRHRALGGLLQSQYAPPSKTGSQSTPVKTNQDMINAAQLNIGPLLRGIPFRPEGNFAAPPPADDKPAAGAVEDIVFQIPTTIAEVRAVQGVEPEAAQGEMHVSLQSRIAREFAEQMRAAVEGMLHAHAAVLAESMGTTIRNEMAAWAASLERSLHRGVHHVLERELGGPVQGPPAPLEDPPGPEVQPERQKQLRVDVVGLVGQNIDLVRKSFNGSVDLKFIDPDQLNGWSPHTGRHAVVTLKWVPHKAKDKLRTVGVVPQMVMGGVGSVIHAIEELMRKEGISAH